MASSGPFEMDNQQIALITVGLPARGKSFLCGRISRYLNWFGIVTCVFNVGSYRRKLLGVGQKHDFFDASNEQAVQQRKELTQLAMSDMLAFFKNGGHCGILDATNTTRERRSFLIKILVDSGIPLHRIVFIESICNDETIIKKNIWDIKVRGDDYKNCTIEEAFSDFRKRIAEYEKVYEPLDDQYDNDKCYVKLVDVGTKIILNRIGIGGFIPLKIANLLMRNHIHPCPVYLTRHGQSEFNVLEKLGGDSELTEKGKTYASVLYEFMKEKLSGSISVNKSIIVSTDNTTEDTFEMLSVWTSSMKRTIQTSENFKQHKVLRWRSLDEIDAGICENMSYAEIKEAMPHEYHARVKSKFLYRYPRGESYRDIVNRLEPVIVELERQTQAILIISHQAVTRVLYAYLMGKSPEDCVHLEIPLHTVIEIIPGFYETKETRYDLNSLVETSMKKGKISNSASLV